VLVVVVTVRGVLVTVVHVVDVVVMGDGLVSAGVAVLVLGGGVLGVDLGGHVVSFHVAWISVVTVCL